ncbi:MAG: prepilin-type N-terminal cleavage/methylation domain-containing protein [Candidatus Paceibacterota bacterium]
MNNFKRLIKNISKTTAGFTLIELLVATFIFGVIMVIVGSAFVNSLNLQRRAFNIQQAQENANFVLEVMAKEIRVAQVNTADTVCPGTPSNTLNITHPVNGDIIYSLSNGVIHRNVNGTDSILSSNTVEFTRVQFCISGATFFDDRQPRVTIIASVRSTKTQQQATIDFQTTLSQRTLSD